MVSNSSVTKCMVKNPLCHCLTNICSKTFINISLQTWVQKLKNKTYLSWLGFIFDDWVFLSIQYFQCCFPLDQKYFVIRVILEIVLIDLKTYSLLQLKQRNGLPDESVRSKFLGICSKVGALVYTLNITQHKNK